VPSKPPCGRKRYLTVRLSSFLLRQVAMHSIVVALNTRHRRMPEKPSISSRSHSTYGEDASAWSWVHSTPCSPHRNDAWGVLLVTVRSQGLPSQPIRTFSSIRRRHCARR